MKIIEGLKKQKDLAKKAEDIKAKIALNCVDMEHENPVYGTTDQQREQINEWLQSYSDILKEILSLRFRIQKTNVTCPVTIELGGKQVTKTIAEWIHRRRDLATTEALAWKCLTDKNLPAVGKIQQTNGTVTEVKIRRYYDPKVRDTKVELFRSEPSIIDSTLEVVNATTDLIE